MAQQEVKIDPDKLSCPICAEVMKDPVTTLCGHSYCMSCINKHWDNERKNSRNSFSCPVCRESFSSRPVLSKSTMLADLVEELTEPGDQCLSRPPDVACDLCPARKRSASKSCTQCMVSYCEEHLQPHYDVPALKRHKLMEPISDLQEHMCSQHNEVKKIFCRTDEKCICHLCHIDQHKGHDTVPAEAEVILRRKELEAGQHRVRVLEGDVSLLQQELRAISESAHKMVSENHNAAEELIQVIKRESSNFTAMIQQQKAVEVSRVQALLMEKNCEIQNVRQKSNSLKQILQTIIYSHCVDTCPTLPQSAEMSRDLQGHTLHYFENISKALSQEKKKLSHSCCHSFKKLKDLVPDVDVLLPRDPKTNEEFSRYSVKLTVDQNTVSQRLTLSEGNKRVTSARDIQFYPPHPDRFLGKSQALMTLPLPPRCYWEVEWRGEAVTVGVSYKDIAREGPSSGFGQNSKSWALECFADKCYAYTHRGESKPLSSCISSYRVGVYLDHKAGVLSFYEVSATNGNKLIHKVQANFTQPLYAGLGLNVFKASAKICVKDRGARGSAK